MTGVPAAFLEALQLARPGGRVVEIGNVSLGKEHEVSLAPGLITRKNLRVQGFVRYQPWYLHALRFLERKHRDHPFDELSDQEYALRGRRQGHRAGRGEKVAPGYSADISHTGGEAMSTVQVESYPAIIGGERVNAGRTFEVLDPSTGRPCAEVARCGEAEIDQAVEAAREAHENTWRRTTPAERARVLHRIAELLRRDHEELARRRAWTPASP